MDDFLFNKKEATDKMVASFNLTRRLHQSIAGGWFLHGKRIQLCQFINSIGFKTEPLFFHWYFKSDGGKNTPVFTLIKPKPAKRLIFLFSQQFVKVRILCQRVINVEKTINDFFLRKIRCSSFNLSKIH
jgi:hypothetical protein